MSLSIITNEIKHMGYDYMYIDDNGIHGTLDSNPFINVKKYYYIDSKGKKRYMPHTRDIGIINRNLKERNVDSSLLKEDETISKEIYSYPLFFTPNENNMNLYLIQGENVIGYVTGSSDTSKITEINEITETTGAKIEIVISYVNIDNNYRGKKLCKLMVQLFLLNVNSTYSKKLSFFLYNVGGIAACRCYFTSFNECGYDTFYYTVDDKEQKTMTNKELCNENMLRMVFLYRGIPGGKRKKNKKICNKTRKKNSKSTSSNKRRLKL